MLTIVGDLRAIAQRIGDAGQIGAIIAIGGRVAVQIGGADQIVVAIVAIRDGVASRISDLRDLALRMLGRPISCIMSESNRTALRIGDGGHIKGAIVTDLDLVVILVLDRGQVLSIICPKDPLLSGLVKGEGILVITVLFQGGIQAWGIGVLIIAAIKGKEGSIAAWSKEGDPLGGIAGIQAQIVTNRERPVFSMIQREGRVTLAVVVALDVQTKPGSPGNLQIYAMQQQIPIGCVDQDLSLATTAGGAINRMLHIRIEGEIAQPIKWLRGRDIERSSRRCGRQCLEQRR